MNKIRLTFLTLMIAVCVMSCKKKTTVDPGKTDLSLLELVKGKTWRLGTVTKNGTTPVTADYTGFTLTFSADATTATIVNGAGAASPGTTTVTSSVAGESVTIATNGTNLVPANWASTLTSASATPKQGEATAFTFTVAINSPKTGNASYKFDLVR